MTTTISTAAELDAMRNDLDEDYVLDSDIDLSGYNDWQPIGSSTEVADRFKGSLDGQNHTISNLTSTAWNGSLLGSTDAEVTVENLTMDNVDARTALIATTTNDAGGLLSLKDITVQNSTVDDSAVVAEAARGSGSIQSIFASNITVRNTNITASKPRGAVIGSNYSAATPAEGHEFRSITVEKSPISGSGDYFSAAVAGELDPSGTVVLDGLSVDADSTIDGENAGGAFGWLNPKSNDVTLRDVDIYAAITSSTGPAGGLIGQVLNPPTTLSITNSDIRGDIDGDLSTGGLVGSLAFSSADDLTLDGVGIYGTITSAGDACGLFGNVEVSSSPNAITVDLDTVDIVGNIDAGGTARGIADNANVAEKWLNGHVESDIHATGEACGLFHDIAGSSIEHMKVGGDISSETSNVFGITNNSSTSATIYRCGVEGALSAPSGSVYGIAGPLKAPTSETYVDATLEAQDEAYGFSDATNAGITDCFAQTTVTSGSTVAGFGYVYYGDPVKRCYVAQDIQTTPSSAYGFASADGGSVATSCYWDDELSSADTTADSAVPLTTGEMTGDSPLRTMLEFDFDTIWTTTEPGSETDGYPALNWMIQTFGPVEHFLVEGDPVVVAR